jgi:cystathionine beta-lyase/cystathionine gamma-synthase
MGETGPNPITAAHPLVSTLVWLCKALPRLGLPEGFIRLSAGCEDGRDLVEDIAQALDASGDHVG